METVLAGHYEIVSYLGGGGFGQTFLAKDIHLPGHPLCVVKQLKPGVTDPATLETAKRLFNREAEALYRLGSHPQIPRLFAHFQQEQEFYLVQEYIAGQTLDQELRPHTPFTEAAVVALLQDILRVLAFVHQQQVIHRDIKPSNLIRRSHDQQMVLIDFGAVKEVSVTSHPTGQTSLTIAVGSPGYMPSEQRSFHPRFSSDIYAVGIVALQALSGLPPKKFPFDDKMGELSCAGFGDRITVSPGLAEILDRMVRYDYRQRYTHALEALHALQTLLNIDHTDDVPALERPIPSPVSDATATLYRVSQFVTQPPAPISAPASLQSLPSEIRKPLEALLSEAIGPIAGVILNSVLAVAVTPHDLIENLARRLPEEARSPFRTQANRLFEPFHHPPISRPISPLPPTGIVSSPSDLPEPSAITAEFIRQCEVSLMQFIGPIAPLIIRRTLSSQASLTPTQLVEALVQHLPKTADAKTFRQSLIALL